MFRRTLLHHFIINVRIGQNMLDTNNPAPLARLGGWTGASTYIVLGWIFKEQKKTPNDYISRDLYNSLRVDEWLNFYCGRGPAVPLCTIHGWRGEERSCCGWEAWYLGGGPKIGASLSNPVVPANIFFPTRQNGKVVFFFGERLSRNPKKGGTGGVGSRNFLKYIFFKRVLWCVCKCLIGSQFFSAWPDSWFDYSRSPYEGNLTCISVKGAHEKWSLWQSPITLSQVCGKFFFLSVIVTGLTMGSCHDVFILGWCSGTYIGTDWSFRSFCAWRGCLLACYRVIWKARSKSSQLAAGRLFDMADVELKSAEGTALLRRRRRNAEAWRSPSFFLGDFGTAAPAFSQQSKS